MDSAQIAKINLEEKYPGRKIYLVEGRFPHLKGRVEINSIGTTIGSHTGLGTVALFFWGSLRKD